MVLLRLGADDSNDHVVDKRELIERIDVRQDSVPVGLFGTKTSLVVSTRADGDTEVLTDEDMTLDEMTAAVILDGIKRHKSSQQDGNPPLESLKRATEDF